MRGLLAKSPAGCLAASLPIRSLAKNPMVLDLCPENKSGASSHLPRFQFLTFDTFFTMSFIYFPKVSTADPLLYIFLILPPLCPPLSPYTRSFITIVARTLVFSPFYNTSCWPAPYSPTLLFYLYRYRLLCRSN